MHRLLPIDPDDYSPHSLHASDSSWAETNCYVDLMVEMVHSLGREPLAFCGFAVASRFEGDAWEFFKPPAYDMWLTYGIEIHENNPWRGVLPHVIDQLGRGRLMTIDADTWFLPDTLGTSYHATHGKTAVIINEVDPAQRVMSYFHNGGYFRLDGDDFDGVLGLGDYANKQSLPPYTELVLLDDLREPNTDELVSICRRLLAHHRARMPKSNPVDDLAASIREVLPELADSQTFHDYAFATLRQCGAAAAVAAAHCAWLATLDDHNSLGLTSAAGHWEALSGQAKTAQLKLARAARGRASAMDEVLEQMAARWSAARDELKSLELGGVAGRESLL